MISYVRLSQAAWLFEPRDLWIGVYLTKTETLLEGYAYWRTVYVMLLPTLGFKISIDWGMERARWGA